MLWEELCALQTSSFITAVSLLHAELNFIVDGLILAESQRYELVIIETDSIIAVQEIYKVDS